MIKISIIILNKKYKYLNKKINILELLISFNNKIK